jgi:hypothetical protein
METYEFDHNLFSKPGAGDESLYVQFYPSYMKDQTKSELEGRPMFKDTEFVKIFVPGDRNNIIDRPATAEDKMRFSKQYSVFKQGAEQRGEGTPLAEWPIVTRSMAEELKYLGFSTVEQIATARDDVVGKYHLQDLKNRAVAYIELAKGSTAPIEQLSKKLEEAEANQRQMQVALDEVVAELRTTRRLLATQDKIAA